MTEASPRRSVFVFFTIRDEDGKPLQVVHGVWNLFPTERRLRPRFGEAGDLPAVDLPDDLDVDFPKGVPVVARVSLVREVWIPEGIGVGNGRLPRERFRLDDRWPVTLDVLAEAVAA